MSRANHTAEATLKHLRWPVRLTRAGMLAESLLHAFWPLFSLVFLVLGALLFGAHEAVPLEVVWAGSVLAALAGLAALVRGVLRFRWPSPADARARLDATLAARPIAALMDRQAIGATDEASRAVWQAHLERMAAQARKARAPTPDLNLARRDPYALRYVALLLFLTAVAFGSVARLATVGDAVAGAGGADLAGGPTWEGWIQPPAYTGKPSLYLADIGDGSLAVPVGSKVTLRLYGRIGALTVAETVSGRTDNIGSAAEANQSFEITRSGRIEIDGPGGRDWQIEAIPDQPPEIAVQAAIERNPAGELRVPFVASDDYGVETGWAEITLAGDAVDRRYGLKPDPEPRDKITLDLPITVSGDRRNFSETLVENLAQHPWAGLPVTLTLFVRDAAGQVGQSAPQQIDLPGRRFFDPLAAALVEQRRDLLWNRTNAGRVAQILRAVSNRPEDIFTSDPAYLKLRVAIRRLEAASAKGPLDDATVQEIAGALWDVAVTLEDGNLADARERLRQAQERLQQAMRDGASDQEIAKLMDELRQAMRDYIQQLAQQQNGQQDPQAQGQNQMEITQDQLQQMMDRIQDLMEQGRMSEAQQLLEALNQMMQNLQVTQGGQGQQGPGQQALEGLADTLRQQQGLNEDTFNDLQRRAEGQQDGNDGAQPGNGQRGQNGQQDAPGANGRDEGLNEGQNGGQDGNQDGGRNGGRDRAQNRPGGQGDQPGQGQGRGAGSDPAQGLAGRQQALRDRLGEQAGRLPGAGTPEGDAAREALRRAERAMEGAEQALRDENFAGALDNQAEALEALRDGMREIARQMAQQQGQRDGQQGRAGQAAGGGQRDPLGRDSGGAGRIGTDDQLLQGEDVYRRARELLDEIRRRSSDQERPKDERDYLKRLLDRF